MKRFMSFMLALSLVMGMFLSPIGSMEVRADDGLPFFNDADKYYAAYSESNGVNKGIQVGDIFTFNNKRSETITDIFSDFSIDEFVTVEELLGDIVNHFNDKIDSNTAAPTIENLSLDDFMSTDDANAIANNIVTTVNVGGIFHNPGYNEIAFQLQIQYLTDSGEIHTTVLALWAAKNGEEIVASETFYKCTNKPKAGNAWLNKIKNLTDGGAFDSISKFSEISYKPSELLIYLFTEYDSNILSNVKSVSEPTLSALNTYFRIVDNSGDSKERGRVFTVETNSNYIGNDEDNIGDIVANIAELENDRIGPLELMDDTTPCLKPVAEYLAAYALHYDTEVPLEVRNESQSKIASSNDFVWRYISSIESFRVDTTVKPIDSGANEVRVPYNLTDYKVAELVLRYSMAYARDSAADTNKTSYVHKITITGDDKAVTIDFSDSGDGYTSAKVQGASKEKFIDLFNSLTPYQQNQLLVTYNNLAAAKNLNTKGLIKDVYQPGGIKYNDKSGNLTTALVDEDMVREAIEEFETNTYVMSPQDVIDIARLSSTLLKYTLYHATNTNFDILDDNASSATYNDVLHNVLGKWGILQGDVSDMFNIDVLDVQALAASGKSFEFVPMPQYVGALESHNNLVNDSVNGDLGFQSIVMLLQAQSYVFEALESSEYSKAEGYSYDNLKAILENPEAATEAEYEGLGDVISFLQQCRNGSQWDAELAASAELSQVTNLWIFRCIIELYDTCELLTITPQLWSPAINNYYRLYKDYEEAFEVMRKSPLLYGTGYTGGATIENPLGVFYSVQGKEMSDKWNIGFANSALYIPMVTNVYDAGIYEFANTKDSDWISEFMYKYGFHRKALYISTDPNIVVNQKLNKSSDNGMVIATLKDLLNFERDIQLYIDTSFYNADQIESAIGKVDYATLYQYMHQQEININVSDEAAVESAEEKSGTEMTYYNSGNNNFVDETLNLDTKTLLKDDDIASYSPDVARNVTHLGETAINEESLYDGYVLSADALTSKDGVFSLYNYTPITSYAVVSAIYRDIEIYNELATVSKNTRTVFESSKNILYTEGSSKRDWISYMNYVQLSNLENQMNVNVETQLDLESPIFMDIFGNIVTESGFVIIPAASNATLCEDNWTPYTLGFGSYMSAGGNDILTEDLPKTVREWLTGVSLAEDGGSEESEEPEEIESVNLDNMDRGTKGGWFVYTRKGNLQLKNVYLESYGLQALVNWSTLNANSDVIQEVFWNNAFFNKAINMYCNRTINMVTEVLRGAPIENIDYAKEGITGMRSGEAGIVIAYALDELLKTLTSDDSNFVNSMTTMPNLAFMEYLDYIIYFGVKIVLATCIVAFLIMLFRAGVKNRIGVKAVFKLALTAVIVVSAIWILPNSIIWSYDTANASMLSDEAEEILLYSSMRQAEGQQIGITEVAKIDENTQLLVKVDTVNPSWSKILGTALLSNEYNSFVDLFDDALKDTPYYGMSGVIQKGSDVYIDVQSIMNSTEVAYSKSNNTLYNKNVIRDEQQFSQNKAKYENGEYVGMAEGQTDGDSFVTQDYYAVYSFTSPYYVILDQLIANVNEYNQDHNVQTYTATVDAKGNVMTYDVSVPYLVSDEFLVEGYDILGLTDALMCERLLPKHTYIFDEQDKMNIKQSAWYPTELDEDTKQVRIAEVYNYARSFIIDHKEVLRHIPDEMILKTLAFACSVKYNEVFKCPYGDSISLITIDNRDLMRFMLSDFKGVYSNVAYSFGRFVYQTSGTIGVILSAILCVIILITTVLKPILIWAMFIIIIINILFREMLFNKPNEGVEGYFIGCGLFMAINFLYSALLKVCFVIADSDLSAVTAMLLCIIVQVLYLLAMAWLIYTQVKDWRNGGFGFYAAGVQMVGGMLNHAPYTHRRGLNGVRRHTPQSPYPQGNVPEAQQSVVDVRLQPNGQPQPVYIDEHGRRNRRNRSTYSGPMTLDQMRQRDEERESSPYRR